MPKNHKRARKHEQNKMVDAIPAVERSEKPSVANGTDAASSTSSTSEYYAYLMENPWVQTAFSTYDWAKHNVPYVEAPLENMEVKVTEVAQATADRAYNAYNNYYVKPKDSALEYYNSGKERTYQVIETGKNVAVQTGTVGLGAAVLATQFGLSLSAGGVCFLLDTAGTAKGIGQNVAAQVHVVHKAVEDKIWGAVSEAQRIAKISVDKSSETTHSLLDIVRALIEKSLKITIEEKADYSVKQRVSSMASAIVGLLYDKAHDQVIDPVTAQAKMLLERMSKSIILIDLVRSKREWAIGKVEELSVSVSDLKARLEAEAKEYQASPEEMLMKYIRKQSVDLKEKINTIKDKGHQVFGDGTSVDSAIDYLERLDKFLGDSEDIYKIRDDVLAETRHQVAELSGWVTSLLSRNQD